MTQIAVSVKRGHNEALAGTKRPIVSLAEDAYAPDAINRDLLSFLADFANESRCFNLDKLAGQKRPSS